MRCLFLQAGQEDGVGMFTFRDGSTYEGFWHKGKKHGVGLFRPAPALRSSTGTAHRSFLGLSLLTHRAVSTAAPAEQPSDLCMCALYCLLVVLKVCASSRWSVPRTDNSHFPLRFAVIVQGGGRRATCRGQLQPPTTPAQVAVLSLMQQQQRQPCQTKQQQIMRSPSGPASPCLLQSRQWRGSSSRGAGVRRA